MPSVVVTGASTGIGEECALRLCRMGWRVFAGVRRTEDGEALRSKASGKDRLLPVLLDVTGGDSIRIAAHLVEEAVEASGLDGLVNNAGIVVGGPLEFLPIEEFRRQIEVNVTGQLAVTQAFLPLLRKARGRIVNMGSVSGRISTPMLGAYCASKFALDALSSTLRMELQPWGIHVAYISPTGIATPIWRKSLAEADRMADRLPTEAYTLYGSVIAAMRARAAKADRAGLPVSEVGDAVVQALTSPRPKARYPVGRAAWLVEILRIIPDKFRERLILRQLHKLSK